MGFAYHVQAFLKEESKGIDEDFSFKIGVTDFGVKSSLIFKKICEILRNPKSIFTEISYWLDEAKSNWNLIDQHSVNINSFKNL